MLDGLIDRLDKNHRLLFKSLHHQLLLLLFTFHINIFVEVIPRFYM